MIKTLSYLVLFLITNTMIAQVNMYSKPIPANPQSTFVPRDLNAINNALQKRQAQYDANLKRIDAIIDWIYDMKRKTSDNDFISALNTQYNTLRSFDGKDLSRMNSQIRNVELEIQEAVYNYNRKIKNSVNKKLSNQDYEAAEIKYFDAKLRNRPDIRGETIGVIPVGSYVYITGKNGIYWEVYYNNKRGYIVENIHFKTTPELKRFE